MDLNKIFKLFGSSDKEEEHKEVVTQVDLSESPMMWIGMFKRMITNYETFAKQLIQFFKSSEPSLDMDEVERASSYMVYDKAYNHLAKLDLTNTTHLDSLQLLSDETFEFVLNKALLYFESVEEYERCLFLKQIQDKVNSFQK
jgi:hypothetical protein